MGELVEGQARAAWDRAQAAPTPGEARRWLERARRLVPQDPTVQAALAATLLRLDAPAEAAPLFQALIDAGAGAFAWTGFAACALAVGELQRAEQAVAAALRCGVPDAALVSVAGQVVARLRLVGWCGLDGDGRVHVAPGRATRTLLDGVAVRGRALPHGWQRAHRLEVFGRGGAPLLGSPIPPQVIGAVEGFVERDGTAVSGWAWHPADPERDPAIMVRSRSIGAMLHMREPADGVSPLRPMARPRRIALAFAWVAAVTDLHGRHLWGSPLPAPDTRPTAPSGPPLVGRDRPPVDVVIPAYRGEAETLACIASVRDTLAPGSVLHVIEDASPEPRLVAALRTLAEEGAIRLSQHAANRGFPASANAGLHAAAGRDVVLLNSDTLVAPGWLERLRSAAYAAPDIGSATPLSNGEGIVGYPDPAAGSAAPDLAGTITLDACAQAANGGTVADIPVGVGFCLYLRRDCLDQVGPFRDDLFAQGYGEENEWCLRARGAGWRHVAALDVFVTHAGGRSFGGARAHLQRRNGALLNQLHPGYDALVAAHGLADPLRPARRAMDVLRWAAGRREAAAILVAHSGGGGVDRAVADRCAALASTGARPIVLRPGEAGSCRVETPGEAMPNLTYAVPKELPALAALLRPDRPTHLECHHLLGHAPDLLDLARLLSIPTDIHVHDYATFCQRLALVGPSGRYCGEPDVPGCEACIAELGSLLTPPRPMRALLSGSASRLAAARRVVAPSRDTATRLRRHFPAIEPMVLPLEDDAALDPPAQPRPGPTLRVCVVGAIGIEKGFDMLLGCAEDARRRALPLHITVCGFTMDDERLMRAGPAFVTGRYAEKEAVALIRAQKPDLAFIPSVCPETWCFALGRAWEAGLPAVAFDLGAQAERIRASGRGWLLPLGLQPTAVNDALLSLAPPRKPPHSAARS